MMIPGQKSEKSSKKEDSEYKFWSTQPVPKLDSAPVEQPSEHHGPIDRAKTVEEVLANPYKLAEGFVWDDFDMTDEAQVGEVYKLLSHHYVEDDDNMFRFDYSKEFLKWALMPPGYRSDWHIAVRAKKSGRLFACITAIPAKIHVHDRIVDMVEINFLCVHKRLRNKRLAPVLIQEVTRRVNLTNRWQAVYTAGVVLPKPVAKNRYFHRSLNPKKLIEIGFSRLRARMTMRATIMLYKVPPEPRTPGIREMVEADLEQAQQLLMNYLADFKLFTEFSVEDFKYWFLPREGVIDCYVVEDPETHELTDMVSFYTLPSSIIGNKNHKTLKAAYSFYNVSTKTPWKQLMTDALIFDKKEQFDVFNALNVMENDKFLKGLKFGIGDGHLQYYLYNWKCPEVKPEEVGLVLL
eukprot:TRINITY_DN194_c0_g1_i1.p1 TRINITY_DN194_c0_g1~~TRINITY_DN194_c0_g1_i1.p1  ORF type:complete len:407 (+),score=82.44 TRINITY_DN194_c0_g1_i1:77-1297(+)